MVIETLNSMCQPWQPLPPSNQLIPSEFYMFSFRRSTKPVKLSSSGLGLSLKCSLTIPLKAKPVEVVTNPISKVMKAVRTPIICLAVFGILSTCTYSAWADSDGSRGVGGTSRRLSNISMPYFGTCSFAGDGGDSGGVACDCGGSGAGAGELYVRFYVEAAAGVAVGALLLRFLFDRSEGSGKTVPFTATELKLPSLQRELNRIAETANTSTSLSYALTETKLALPGYSDYRISVFSSNGLDTKAGKSGKQVKMRKNKAKKICRVKKNGLDTKAGKSRKQIKMRKNKTKKIRVVKKTKAGDDAEAGKK